MARTSYPTAADLSAYLLTLGTLTSTSGLGDLDTVMEGAAQDWEQATGWRPFAPQAVAADTYYDPPRLSERLELGAAYFSITEVADSADAYSTPASTGTLLTQGTDYLLEPYNATAEASPIVRIRFLRSCYGNPRSIRVKGKRGWAAEVPGNVWQAILQHGASVCHPQLSALVGGGVLRLKTQATEVQFGAGGGALTAEKAGWDALWQRTVRQYRRASL